MSNTSFQFYQSALRALRTGEVERDGSIRALKNEDTVIISYDGNLTTEFSLNDLLNGLNESLISFSSDYDDNEILSLVDELLYLKPALHLPIIANIKHHNTNYSGPCCKLHECISLKLRDHSQRHILYLEDTETFRKCVEYYGQPCSRKLRIKMLVRLFNLRILSFESVISIFQLKGRCDWDRRILDNDNLKYYVYENSSVFLERVVADLWARGEFLTIALINSLLRYGDNKQDIHKVLGDEVAASSGNLQWWLLCLENESYLNEREKNLFAKAACDRSLVDGESFECQFYRGCIKKMLQCDKRHLAMLSICLGKIGKTICPVTAFRQPLAKILYDTPEAQQLFDLAQSMKALPPPFWSFPDEYIKYGFPKCYFRIADDEYETFDDPDQFCKLNNMKILFRGIPFEELDEILRFKLTDVFVQRVAQFFGDSDYLLAMFDIPVQNYPLRILQEAFPELIRFLSHKDITFALLSLDYCPREEVDKHASFLHRLYNEPSTISKEEFIRETFDPNINPEYRRILLMRLREMYRDTAFEPKSCEGLIINYRCRSTKEYYALLKNCEDVEVEEKIRSCYDWSFLQTIPLGVVWTSHAFWKYIVYHFYNSGNIYTFCRKVTNRVVLTFLCQVFLLDLEMKDKYLGEYKEYFLERICAGPPKEKDVNPNAHSIIDRD